MTVGKQILLKLFFVVKELKYSKTFHCHWWLSGERSRKDLRKFAFRSHCIRNKPQLEISQLLYFFEWRIFCKTFLFSIVFPWTEMKVSADSLVPYVAPFASFLFDLASTGSWNPLIIFFFPKRKNLVLYMILVR